MEYIRRKRNPIGDLSKFIFNKKILSKVVILGCYQLTTKRMLSKSHSYYIIYNK